jgi:anti-anti-sigma factor
MSIKCTGYPVKTINLFRSFQLGEADMEITKKEEGGIVQIEIVGRLDAASAGEADETVAGILNDGANKLLFNLSRLEYLSSAGLRVLLAAAKKIRLIEGKVVLCSLTEYVKEIFEVSGFESLIPIADSVEAGLKELS